MSTMTEHRQTAWGITSPHVLYLARLIEDQISACVDDLRNVPFYSSVGNIEPALTRKIELTNNINGLSKDLRSMLTAYAHKVHEPRPRVTSIAEAQGTTTQGLLRRYNAQTADAVRAVADGQATKALLTEAFPSLPVALIDAFLSAGPAEYIAARLEYPGLATGGSEL